MENNKTLIVLSGRARVGKDSVANYMKSLMETLYQDQVETIAYADVLKQDLMTAFDLTSDQVYGDKKEVPDTRYLKNRGEDVRGLTYWTPREMMQSYGSFMRTIDNNYWINKVFDKLDKISYTKAIITDARHINEVKIALDKGGIHIRVVRENADRITDTKHESEVALDGVAITTHYTINNNGSFLDLQDQVDKIVKSISSSN